MVERTLKRAVILAAGRGSRLVAHDEFPKPLKLVAGVPMLVRVLRTLQGEGITEAVIVIGWRGDSIKRALLAEPSLALKLIFVEVERTDCANGVSLLAAAPWIDQDCILSMADHLYAPTIIRRLREADLRGHSADPPKAGRGYGSSALAVDRDIERCFDLPDATKVKLAGSRIVDIGKELDDFDAVDTGVFRINAGLIDKLREVYAARGDCSLSEGVRALAAIGKFVSVDAGEARWIDVDTPEAHARAEAMIRVWGEALGDDPTAAALIDPEAMEQFAPTWVRAAEPYKEDHFEIAEAHEGVARLMSNESPFAPSERVIEAIVDAARGGNKYPTGAGALREKLGVRDGLRAEAVVLGAGSTELIDLVIRTFVAPGEEVLVHVPTFSMYEARTRVVGGIPVLVPMGEDWAFDVPAMLRAITERTKVVFLCTPNNPTGNRIEEPDLRRILRLGLPTVIDEAYLEFAGEGAESHARVLDEFPNAIIVRTFSKAFGLAGLRLGYALAHPAVARLMSRAKLPWNVSAVTIAAASAALDDVDEQRARLLTIRSGRAWLTRELGRLVGVKAVPSEGNFVLCDIADTGLTSEAIVAAMLDAGVFLRSLTAHHMNRGYLRVSVGTRAQNEQCVEALARVLGSVSAGAHRKLRPANNGSR